MEHVSYLDSEGISHESEARMPWAELDSQPQAASPCDLNELDAVRRLNTASWAGNHESKDDGPPTR
jgi:hypothetical protein